MDPPPQITIRRKQINPALIEKVCHAQSASPLPSAPPPPPPPPPLSSEVRQVSASSPLRTPDPADPPAMLTLPLASSPPASETHSPKCQPSTPFSAQSPPTHPVQSPPSLSAHPPSLHSCSTHLHKTSSICSMTSAASSNCPPSRREGRPSTATTKGKARKWLQGTRAFFEGMTNAGDGEERILYFSDKYKMDFDPPTPPPAPPKIYDYTPPPSRIYLEHADLQLMHRALKYDRDRLWEELRRIKSVTLAELQKQNEVLTAQLKQERDTNAKLIRYYEGRVRGWARRYDRLHNRWAQQEGVDKILQYPSAKDADPEEDPVVRAAIKCHVFESDVLALVQRIAEAAHGLKAHSPLRHRPLPTVLPSNDPVLLEHFVDTFLNANKAQGASQALSEKSTHSAAELSEPESEPHEEIPDTSAKEAPASLSPAVPEIHLHGTPPSGAHAPGKAEVAPISTTRNSIEPSVPLPPLPCAVEKPPFISTVATPTLPPSTQHQLLTTLPVEEASVCRNNSMDKAKDAPPPSTTVCKPNAAPEKNVHTPFKDDPSDLGLDTDILDLIDAF